MNKKCIMLLLALSLFFSTITSVSADSNITLNSILTCDGRDVVFKQTGDIITVTYTLENVTDPNDKYFMLSHTNEFYYNNSFFEYVPGSAVSELDTIDTLHQRWGDSSEYSVSFNGMPLENWDSKLFVGTFQLKVIATEGSSTIYSKDIKRSIRGESEKYTVTSDDLTVIIGDPAPEYVVETSDYISNKKIVLAYTNDNDISFEYDGETMYDITSKGYTYGGEEEFASNNGTKVYGLVVDIVQDGDLDNYRDRVTVVHSVVDNNHIIVKPDSDSIYDLNDSGEVEIGDLVSAYGVFYADGNIYPSFMKLILRTDVNNDKCVDEKDIKSYTDAFISARNK